MNIQVDTQAKTLTVEGATAKELHKFVKANGYEDYKIVSKSHPVYYPQTTRPLDIHWDRQWWTPSEWVVTCGTNSISAIADL